MRLRSRAHRRSPFWRCRSRRRRLSSSSSSNSSWPPAAPMPLTTCVPECKSAAVVAAVASAAAVAAVAEIPVCANISMCAARGAYLKKRAQTALLAHEQPPGVHLVFVCHRCFRVMRAAPATNYTHFDALTNCHENERWLNNGNGPKFNSRLSAGTPILVRACALQLAAARASLGKRARRYSSKQTRPLCACATRAPPATGVALLRACVRARASRVYPLCQRPPNRYLTSRRLSRSSRRHRRRRLSCRFSRRRNNSMIV